MAHKKKTATKNSQQHSDNPTPDNQSSSAPSTKPPRKRTRNRREYRKRKNRHRARLVVRNLPFDTTEDELRSHFGTFGELDEVTLLKREDGRSMGVGFVQFKLVQKAAKARHHLSGKPFKDRNIECDWALSRDKYAKLKTEVKVEVKEEPPESEEDANKTVVEKEEELDDEEIKSEVDVELDDEDVKSEVDMLSDEEDVKSEVDIELDDEEDVKSEVDSELSDDQSEPTDDEIENKVKLEMPERKKVISNDITEGKTLFVKNVPFSANNNDLRNRFLAFGPIYYALICMDPLTEHSKGSGFVKFKNQEDAQECLSSTDPITLSGQVLDVQPAVSRQDLDRKLTEKRDSARNRDSRNLYLAREGVIVAGTKAAQGVSAGDMAKRLEIERHKTQMLRSLNMIVARTRLIVHNLPLHWTDAKLRSVFAKYADAQGKLKESKIMRDMKVLDSQGIGRSKGYGFVGFTNHEAALRALRAVNNNPSVMSDKKRLIVGFSIENRAKLANKSQRLQNSVSKNPNRKNEVADKEETKKRKSNEKEEVDGSKKRKVVVAEDKEQEEEQFSGVKAKPGNRKMRSRFDLKTQAKVHHEYLKKEKKRHKKKNNFRKKMRN